MHTAVRLSLLLRPLLLLLLHKLIDWRFLFHPFQFPIQHTTQQNVFVCMFVGRIYDMNHEINSYIYSTYLHHVRIGWFWSSIDGPQTILICIQIDIVAFCRIQIMITGWLKIRQRYITYYYIWIEYHNKGWFENEWKFNGKKFIEPKDYYTNFESTTIG